MSPLPGTPQRTIGAFTGSGRVDGWGHRLLQATAGLAPEGLEIVELPVHLPHYDAENDGDATPDEVAELRERVAALDGLFIVTPEFNHSVPGVLKNTIDWLSRPAYRSPLRDLPVTAIAFSPGPVGGARGLAQLKAVFTGTASALLPWPELAVGEVAQKFAGPDLVDEATRKRLAGQLTAFGDWVEAVSAYRLARHA